MLSAAVQHAIGGTALGAPWLLPRAAVEPPLDQVLALAEPIGPSRPANAPSMVLTARSSARCSRHKLLLGAKKTLGTMPRMDPIWRLGGFGHYVSHHCRIA